MSSHRLSIEVSRLVSEARNRRIQDLAAIKELTLIAGYAHLIEGLPNGSTYLPALQKHLLAFRELVCASSDGKLCDESEGILKKLMGDGDLPNVA